MFAVQGFGFRVWGLIGASWVDTSGVVSRIATKYSTCHLRYSYP